MLIKFPWSAFSLGALLCAGLVALGSILGLSLIKHREFERSVVVKGLSVQEYAANIVIWPIEFSAVDNDIARLYELLEEKSLALSDFFETRGIAEEDISISAPAITDTFVNQYRNSNEVEFRFTGTRAVTVYSENVELVRATMADISEIGKEGLVINGNNWRSTPQYLFSNLNEAKPQMVEEATRNAREVAEKFAEDSESSLGRIKHATQGQFSINNRDANNPHIKSVRVVSTIEYYLID